MRMVEKLRGMFSGSETMANSPEGENLENLIRGIDLFSRLESSSIKKLARLCSRREFLEGEMMIKKGDPGLGMLVILSGRAVVFDQRDGKDVILASLKTGDSVGEMALIDAQPRSANVKALQDCKCLLLTRDNFKTLNEKDPEIIWSIVPLLVERLRRTTGQMFTKLTPDDGVPPSSAEPETAGAAAQKGSGSKPASDQGDSGHISASETKEDAMADEDEVVENTEDNSLVMSSLQFFTSSFMFCSSMTMLGAQESLNLVTGRESVGKNMEKTGEVFSSITTEIEKNMGETTKKVFTSYQEFLGSLLSTFQR